MIQVHIAKDALDHAGHEALVGQRIVESLRQAGVPVEGFFALRGVPKGSLTFSNSEDLDGVVHSFTWSEDAFDILDEFSAKPVRSQLKNGSVVYKSGRHAEDDEL